MLLIVRVNIYFFQVNGGISNGHNLVQSYTAFTMHVCDLKLLQLRQSCYNIIPNKSLRNLRVPKLSYLVTFLVSRWWKNAHFFWSRIKYYICSIFYKTAFIWKNKQNHKKRMLKFAYPIENFRNKILNTTNNSLLFQLSRASTQL
jgi:hypothetical protein